MRFQVLIAGSGLLLGCTRSCATESKSGAQAQETWKLAVTQLQPALNLTSNAPTELILSNEKLTLVQGQNKTELAVVSWDKPDFAKLTFEKAIGYFKWDMFPQQRRYRDETYKCFEGENSPEGITRFEEAEQVKTVRVHLEDVTTRAVTFHLEAVVPEASFWVPTTSQPLKTCPPPTPTQK